MRSSLPPLLATLALISGAGAGTSLPAADCNGNGEDDAAEIAAGRAPDCNRNGTPDACDVERSRRGLEVRTRLELGVAAASLAVGDLDGNGRPDIVAGTPGGPEGILLYFQDTSGAFAPPRHVPTDSAITVAVEVADLDGSGDLDLAVASIISSHVGILLGQGDGAFSEPRYLQAERPTDLDAADIDGDGDVDLAYPSVGGGFLSILRNDAAGQFSEEKLPDDSRPVSIATADLNLDGKLDLIAGHEANLLTIHRSKASGGFQFREIVTTSSAPLKVVAADFTGDQYPDVAAVTGQVLFFRNRGDGFDASRIHGAGPNPYSIGAADIDGDADLDLAVMNWEPGCDAPFETLHVLRNMGSGDFFTAERFPGGPHSFHAPPLLTVADMDGDGQKEIITTAGAGPGTPGFATILSPSLEASSGDCNADGVPDECEPDCNWNGAPDTCDIARGSIPDADLDGRPDDCQPDCNRNGAPDPLDIAEGSSLDADGSGFPDECERVIAADCDGNGTEDAIDIAAGAAPDCNANGRPDACDVELRYSFDALEGFSARVRESGRCAAADLDGDGIVDFAVAARAACCPLTPHPGGVALFRGLGGGRFGSLGEQSLSAELTDLAAADIDGDGDADIVTSNASTCVVTDTISILRNDGKGKLSPPASFPAHGRPTVLHVMDMDASGSPDILAFCGAEQSFFVRIFRNDGSGSFTEGPVSLDVGIDAWHVVPADLNGDLLPDVAIAKASSSSVQVLLASGGLRFGAPRGHAAGTPSFLAPGDLDGDGDADLAVLQGIDSSAEPSLAVLWNDGAGGFPSRTTLGPGVHAYWAAVKDLNGDGLLDIATLGIPRGFASGQRTGILGAIMSRGGGAFAGPSRFIVDGLIDHGFVEDMDGDGDQDVLATLETDSGSEDRAFVFWNAGAGAFRTTGRLDVPGVPGTLAAADLDADGKLDLAVTDADDPGVGVFWNAAGGAFSAPELHVLSQGVAALEHADLDGDGDTDLAAATPSSVELFFNNASRPLVRGQRLVAGSNPVAMAARDLDGDGDVDIVTANSVFQEFDDSISVFSNLGGGRFAPPRNFAAGRRPGTMAAADFDSDGDIDLAIRNYFPGGITFLENDGRGAFAKRVDLLTDAYLYFIIACDADGDADPDLAAGPPARFLLNRGGWSFEWGGEQDAPFNFSMAAGDLDGDGAPEIVAGMSESFQIIPNLGGGRLGPWGPPETSPDGGGASDSVSLAMRGVVAADLDGDGRNDLAGSVASEDSHIVILINRTFRPSIDGNGDGVPDECGGDPFRRGDANDDSNVDLSDAVHILRSLFLGEGPLACGKAADANDDSRLDVSDPVSILGVLFLGDPELPAPSQACGPDPTEDTLGCAAFGGCA